MPEPTIIRIPRAVDGSTWYAYTDTETGRIGASSLTKRGAVAAFEEQWTRFGGE